MNTIKSIINEAVKKAINEIGDTDRGKAAIGKLAANRYGNNKIYQGDMAADYLDERYKQILEPTDRYFKEIHSMKVIDDTSSKMKQFIEDKIEEIFEYYNEQVKPAIDAYNTELEKYGLEESRINKIVHNSIQKILNNSK